MVTLTDVATKINALYGYTPTTNQILQNAELLQDALLAIGGNVATLTDIANTYNALMGTSYDANSIKARPDLIRLSLLLSNAEGGIADGSIGTAKLADNSVTTSKILDANVTPAKLSQPLTRATSVSLNGSTVADWSIPAWAKKITLMLNEVGTNGSSHLRVRLGVGGTPETTGYICLLAGIAPSGVAAASATGGFDIHYTANTYAVSGEIKISNLSGNIWTFSCQVGNVTTAGYIGASAGVKTLAGVLDLIRLTTVSGDTFDGGSSANLIYE